MQSILHCEPNCQTLPLCSIFYKPQIPRENNKQNLYTYLVSCPFLLKIYSMQTIAEESRSQIHKGRCQKKPFFCDFVPNYGQVGVQSPKLFSENNHSVILTANPLFLGLCPKIGVAVGGWGPRVPNKYMGFVRKPSHFFKKKNKMP